jgi:hypothetical protein
MMIGAQIYSMMVVVQSQVDHRGFILRIIFIPRLTTLKKKTRCQSRDKNNSQQAAVV